MSGVLGAGQLGEYDYFSVALSRYVVHFKTFKIVNESFGNVVLLEQNCLFGLIFVSNLSLDRLRVYVAS